MSAHSPESEPLLPQVSSQYSRTSSNAQKRTLTRAERAREVEETPDVAHDASTSGTALPAAAIDPAQRNELHDPRWSDYEGPANAWARTRYVWREELAECLGTAMILLFGAGVECQVVLHYSGNNHQAYSFGDYNTCVFAWAVGVAAGVWVAGGISGAHLNPSITIALWLFRGFPGKKVGWFILAQVAGATLASLLVYFNYRYSIGIFEGDGLPSSVRSVTGPHATAPLFFTFPKPWLPASSAFFAEAIATGALVLMVFTLSDKGNMPTPKGTMAIALFIVLIGIGSALGVNTGYALNGARDMGPRIALWIVGYGSKIWTHDNAYWIWGPWAGAITGGVLGGLTYDVFIYTGKDSFVNRPEGGSRNPKRNGAIEPDAAHGEV